MRVMTYIEEAENVGQALARPLTVCCGTSYNKFNVRYDPSLSTKIKFVALAIIFFPLVLPLIALGCLIVACSEEHKKRFTWISAAGDKQMLYHLNLLKDKLFMKMDTDVNFAGLDITNHLSNCIACINFGRDLPRAKGYLRNAICEFDKSTVANNNHYKQDIDVLRSFAA